jgi:D-amino-acid oxidase
LPRLSRRQFLSASALSVAGSASLSALALSGCATRRVRLAHAPALPNLAPVNVSAERLIRITVGLRPFRPSGFVVRSEKLGDKIVIHNYGHGGGGITLSWGTAQLAADEASKTGLRDCAVIGCGVIGLSTARILQQRGFDPVIYAREMPPDTTSNVAGGLWDPVTVFDGDNLTPDFRRQFVNAAHLAHRRYQLLTGDEYGVRWLPLYNLSNDKPFSPPPPESAADGIQDLFPESRILASAENPFACKYARRRDTLLIEPSIYLDKLIRDFLVAGGKIRIRNFATASELNDLTQPLLFNCTGLGAKTLFNDPELTPIKGQLSFLLPQPEIDYCTVGPGDIYMFPRRDGIVLGGSHARGVWSTDPEPDVSQRILKDNAALFASMRQRA